MSEVTAEVYVEHDEIPRFQTWLSHECHELTHGVDRNSGSDATEILRSAQDKIDKVLPLIEQGEKAVAGEGQTYRGDAEILLSLCHAMVGEYAGYVAIHNDPAPWDFESARKNIGPLSRWIHAGREIQEQLEKEAVPA